MELSKHKALMQYHEILHEASNSNDMSELLVFHNGEMSSKNNSKSSNIIVSADKFSKFEDEKLINQNVTKQVGISADAFNFFEEEMIKNVLPFNNNVSASKTDMGKSHDINDSDIKVEGGIPDDNKSILDTLSLQSTSSTLKHKIVIKNLSGKTVTIVPKTTPMLINKNKLNTKNIKTIISTPNINILPQVNAKSFKNLKSILKNNLNFSTKFSAAEVLITQPDFKKNETNALSSCSKQTSANISNCVNIKTYTRNVKNAFTTTDINAMPMYVDNHTQTDFENGQEKNVKSFVECGIQTDSSSNASQTENSTYDELPNITGLLEYLFETPQYSYGIDEMKKSSMLNMSKNIAIKTKNMSPNSSSATTNLQMQTSRENIKMQFFLDLKNCLKPDFLGNMPIHNAIVENNISLLKRTCYVLRLRKVSIDIENSQRQTPLQLAILHKSDFTLISVLLSNGANTSVKDSEGNTILHMAVMHSTDYNLNIILHHSSYSRYNIDDKNDDGVTPLMLASIESKADMVEVLLKNGADPNIRDEKSGRTALFHAVEINSNIIINLLLKYKADPKIRNFFGLTALDAAKDLDVPQVRMLESHEENISPASNMNLIKRPINYANINSKQSTTKKPKLCFVPSLQKVQLSELSSIHTYVKKKKH